MIDEDFVVYLIEANTNPCLELSCTLLQRIIPQMLESAFRIAIDPLLPPVDMNFKRSQECLQENKFIQIFDEDIESDEIYQLYQSKGFFGVTLTSQGSEENEESIT